MLAAARTPKREEEMTHVRAGKHNQGRQLQLGGLELSTIERHKSGATVVRAWGR
jgi:hypothetical protein